MKRKSCTIFLLSSHLMGHLNFAFFVSFSLIFLNISRQASLVSVDIKDKFLTVSPLTN